MKQLKCGAAQRIVTPALGLEIPGYFGGRVATGVKDDLYTQAVVLDDGKKLVAIVSSDIIDYKSTLTHSVRRKAKAALGLDIDIMMAATHTHTGMPTNQVEFDAKTDAKTIRNLIDKTVECIEEAYRTRVPVKIGYGEGEEKRISFCRNYFLSDGTIKTNPGAKRAHMIVKPVSKIDYTVAVMRFDDANGKTVAQMVNFACHPDTVGGHEYCADYPGEMRRILKENYGDDCVVLFLNGCAGDINHIDASIYLKNPEYKYPKDHYKWMGQCLAETVLSVNQNMKFDVEGELDCLSKTFRQKRRQPTAEEAAWATDGVTHLEDFSVSDAIYAKEIYSLVVKPRYYNNVEIQAIRIGDCAVVSLPGEIFADVGFAVKENSPFKRNMVVELGNGTNGYIVTEPCFSGGVYEAKLSMDNACLPTEVAGRMADVAGELLEKLAK